MERNKRLLKTTIIYFIGTFGSKLLIFFLLPLYSNYLSTEQYGNLNLITNLVPLIGPVFTLQVTETIFRFLCTAKKDEKPKYISNSVFLLLVGLAIFTVIYIPIAIITDFKYLWLFLLYFITNYMAIFVQQILRGFGKNIDYSVTGIISTITQLLINIIMIKFIYEKSILLATTMGSLVIMIYVLFRIKIFRYINIKLISKDTIKEMLKYSLPLIPNQISWWFNDTAGLYILKLFVGAGATGITSLSNKFPSMLATINNIFLLAWTENSIYEFKREDKEKYFSESFQNFTIIMLLLCCLILPAVKVYFELFINVEYRNAIGLVPIMFLAMVFNALASFLGTVYTASMKTKEAFTTTLTAAISNVVLAFMLVPKLNIYGYAIANAVSYVIFYVVRKKSVNKIITIKEEYKNYIVPILFFILTIIIYYIFGYKVNIVYEIIALVVIGMIYFKKIKLIIVRKNIKKQI